VNLERYFWLVAGLILVMSIVSGYDNPLNFGNMVDLALWCGLVPTVFAFIFQVIGSTSKKARFILGSNFIFSASFTLVILSMTLFAVIIDGPLNESTLIFMVMPFGYFISFVVATPIGLLAYAISKDV
jgi:hypothetical protein